MKQDLKSQSSSKKKIPEGKVVFYAYVKPENKTYFELIAKDFGGTSTALDILLDYMRHKKQRISVHRTRKPQEAG